MSECDCADAARMSVQRVREKERERGQFVDRWLFLPAADTSTPSHRPCRPASRPRTSPVRQQGGAPRPPAATEYYYHVITPSSQSRFRFRPSAPCQNNPRQFREHDSRPATQYYRTSALRLLLPPRTRTPFQKDTPIRSSASTHNMLRPHVHSPKACPKRTSSPGQPRARAWR